MRESATRMRRLFNPTRIGIIGATETPGKVGRIVFDYLRRSSAELFPVNPKIQTILGYPVLPSTENLPEDLDLVVVTIGAAAAVEAAETCARKKAANIIIIAGGFGETGAEGRLLEERLKTLPAKYGSRILGPNSLGVFVPSAKLDTIFVEHGDAALAGGGGIAFITQSGSVGVESLGLASNTGFGLRAFVGIGNKADLDESDFLTWFGSDSGTDTLALYVESIEKGRLFLEQARGIARRKPLVLLKAGRTLAGASAASSHTGRLAGSDNVVSGALRQYGIQRAFDDEELCDAAKTLSMVKPAAGNRVAVITAAGGFGVMCTDYIDTPDRHAPLRMAVLSEKTKERIRFGTLPFASVHNPVDLTAGADDAMYLLALDALLADEGVDIVICVTFFAPPSITDMLSEKMAAVIRKAEKPVLVFTQYGPFTDTYLKNFYKSGVAGFSSLSRVVRAARFLVERSRNLRHLKEAPAAPFAPTADYQDIFSAWKQRLEVPGHANEWEAKLLMRSAGLPVPPGYLLSPRDPLPNVETLSAAGIAPPYAVKLCSARVLHKTDVGGVVLGVEAKDLHPVLESARRKFPGENLLIGSMLPIRGPEFIIGALKDPAFGAAIMVGVGGILTELYRDVSFRLAPCDPREVERMLMELTVAPILNGFRGSKADLAQLVAIIARFSEMAAVVVESGAQMDINPIIWNGESWFVLDAKVVL